jgi:predicted choloylglycine hydrolase
LAFVLPNHRRRSRRKSIGATKAADQLDSHKYNIQSWVRLKSKNATGRSNTLNKQNAGIKAFDEKASGELQKAKSQVEEAGAHVKEKASQAESNAIKDLKNKKQEMDKKLQDLKTAHQDKGSAAQS